MPNSCGLESSKGVVFQRRDPDTDTYEGVVAFAEIPQPSFTASTDTCPNFDTPAGWQEYYKTGDFDQSEVSLLINFRPGDTVHPKLYDDFKRVGDNELVDFRILFANDSLSQMDFSALITAWGLTIPTDPSAGSSNIIQIPISLRPSGEPIWTE